MNPDRGGGAGVPKGQWMICAVCYRVLELLTKEEGDQHVPVAWLHPYAERAELDADHEAIPIPEKEFSALATISERCDFCYAERPDWVLPVEDFAMFQLDNTQHNSRSDWSCCNDCAELIRKGYWDRLTRRAIKSFKDRRGFIMPEAEVHIRTMYRKVSEHTTGMPYPNPTYHRPSREEETGGTE